MAPTPVVGSAAEATATPLALEPKPGSRGARDIAVQGDGGKMKARSYVLGLICLAGAVFWSTATAGVAGSPSESVVRFDLVSIVDGGALSGGTAVSTAVGPTGFVGDTLTLTASGTAEPSEGEASGGGTFVHKAPDGTVKVAGFYTVTRFVSWRPTSGSFAATGLTDAIGSADEAHAGVLQVRVRFWSGGNVVANGLMTITCALPGAPAGLEEGVTVNAHPVGTDLHIRFTEKTAPGPTLFHVIN